MLKIHCWPEGSQRKAVSGVVEAGRLARPRYFRPYWKKIDDPSFSLIVKK